MEPPDRPRSRVLMVTVWPDEDPRLRVRARFVTSAGSGGPPVRSAAAGSEDIVRWFRAWLDESADDLVPRR